MNIITVRIHKNKSMYMGKDVTENYGNQWEFKVDAKNRQIKARPSVNAGITINNGRTFGMADVINRINIDHLFIGRSSVIQAMIMGDDGWFTTNIDHPMTKAQRKIEVKKSAANRKLDKEEGKKYRRMVRATGEISIRIKYGKICIPAELCGKINKIYARTSIDDNQCVIMLSTTKISTEYHQRSVEPSGVICLYGIKRLSDYFSESTIRVQAEYDRGVYTAVVNLGSKVKDASCKKISATIERKAKQKAEVMTFWQRVKFVLGV